jgi:predicted ribosome quality control (RQC) complex YloA/Tae2 family protein
MKTEISSLELYYLLKELQHLVSAKVEQIYQIGKEELIIQFHIPSIGKQILRVILGKLMYIASNKGDVPEKPHGFCLFLRRKLKNSRLRQLKQLGFERIVEFLFETKDAKFRLIIELFSKGNIILCNEEGIIISALEQQEWKDRTVKPKQQYIYPKKEYNFLVIEKNELTELLHTSKKENLVKTLAIDLGLGGVYAEELCMIAKIDKNLKSNQLSDTEIDSIHSAIQTLSSKEMSPQIIYTSQEKKSIKDLTPFKLEFNKDLPSGLEKSEKENQRKGEVIYENYPLVEQALAEIKELKKTLSWKEISKRFKGHKIIKSINEKTGEITIEL